MASERIPQLSISTITSPASPASPVSLVSLVSLANPSSPANPATSPASPASIYPFILPTRSISPAEAQALRNWEHIEQHVGSNWYKPDLTVLRAALTVHRAQFDPQGDSLWLFINGPSSSGKTSIIIYGCSDLPNCHMLGEISENTLLSCFSGDDNASLLFQIGSGTLLFKDFTTLLSLRTETLKQIASQLREVADGEWSKQKGNVARHWKGKISCIAATTPVIEQHFSLLRSMGDRFLQVRWPRLDGLKVAHMARKQQGREKQITNELKRRVATFFQAPKPNYSHIPDVNDSQADRLAALAEIMVYCRGSVTRDPNSREIIQQPQIDNTGRGGKALPAYARFHAHLFHREQVTEADMQLSHRIAMDSIPFTRSKILNAIPPLDTISGPTICELTGITPSALQWTSEELIALGVLEKVDNGLVVSYRMSRYISELWQMTGF